MQIGPIEMTLLFLKQKQAEEVRFQFPKATSIQAMSFVIADDFNFVLATNNLITLYDVKLNKQKAKTVNQIPIANMSEPVRIFFEPLACTLVAIDSKGQCQPHFLNLYKTKQLKGKLFQLELA